MPYVPKFQPGELQKIAQSMQEYPPEKVQEDYLLGKISLNDKLFMLRTYGDAQREISVMGETAAKVAKEEAIGKAGGGARGEVNYWWENQVSQYKAAWDAATREKDPSKSQAVIHAMMGAFETLRGFDVPGDIVERKMLEKYPDSPGFARAANWAVWGAVNFYGISNLLKLPFKAAQKTAQVAVSGASKLSNMVEYLKDPVKYVTNASRALDASVATSAAQKAVGEAAQAAETTAGKQAFKTAAPGAAGATAMPGAVVGTPQDLEAMTTRELIKHYENRANEMVRKGVSHADTKAAASAKPVSFEDILARGADESVSAREIESIGRVHDEVLKNFNAVVDEAMKNIEDVRAGRRPDLVQAYKAHLAAVNVTNPAWMSARGQTGRGLEYMKEMQDLVKESQVFDASTRALAGEKFLESNDAAVAQGIERMAELTTANRDKLIKGVADNPDKPGLIRTFYKSLLFARPGTHIANIVGNEGSATLYGINKTASAMMPGSNTSMREALAYWGGMWDSRKKFFDIWEQASKKAATSLEKAGIEGTPTGAMIQHGPLNWLGFEDEFMRGHVSHALAKSEAAKQGLTAWDRLRAAGTEMTQGKTKFLADYIDNAMNNPDVYKQLVDATEKEADYIIFRSPMSRGGEAIAQGIRQTPLDYLMPVVKFPIAALKMGRDWTPGIQMLSKDFIEALAEGGAKSDMARARMTLSWMISSQIYEAAKAGTITGGGPIDPEANAVWRAAGNKPYSIHGYEIKWAEPFGTWVGGIADLAQASNEMKQEDVGDMFSAFMLVGRRAIESNYWLRILQGTTRALDDAARAADLNDYMAAGAKTVLQPFKTIAQGGPVGRVVSEMMDPTSQDMRFYHDLNGELDDLKQWFTAGTVWGKGGRPRQNYSGNDIITPPTLGADWVKEHLNAPDWLARGLGLFSPPVREAIGDDPVAEILAKHGLQLNDNWKYYGSGPDPGTLLPMRNAPRVNLSGDQAYNWKRLSLKEVKEYGTGRTWVEAMQAWDQDPATASLTKDEKQKEVNRMHSEFRRDGLDILRGLDPDIAVKEAERDRIEALQKDLPMPAPQDQPEEGPATPSIPYPVQMSTGQ